MTTDDSGCACLGVADRCGYRVCIYLVVGPGASTTVQFPFFCLTCFSLDRWRARGGAGYPRQN